MFAFKEYIMKLTSKSPRQRLIRLQAKLKLTEKKKLNIPKFIYYYYSVFHSTGLEEISLADLG